MRGGGACMASPALLMLQLLAWRAVARYHQSVSQGCAAYVCTQKPTAGATQLLQLQFAPAGAAACCKPAAARHAPAPASTPQSCWCCSASRRQAASSSDSTSLHGARGEGMDTVQIRATGGIWDEWPSTPTDRANACVQMAARAVRPRAQQLQCHTPPPAAHLR